MLLGKDQVKYLTRLGEMVQSITAPDLLIEDEGAIPRTYMLTHSICEDLIPFSGLCEHLLPIWYIWCT